MRVLVATAGATSPGTVAGFVSALPPDGLEVTVLTAVEVPRGFLEELDTDEWRPLERGDGAPDISMATTSYVNERGARLAEPVVVALDAAGFRASTRFVASSKPADAILDEATALNADLIVMGATRPLFEEWESVAVQVMQGTTVPLVLLPAVSREVDERSGQ